MGPIETAECESEESTPARAMRLIRTYYDGEQCSGDWHKAVTRYVGHVGDAEASGVLDIIGHWPSSETELRALQRHMQPFRP